MEFYYACARPRVPCTRRDPDQGPAQPSVKHLCICTVDHVGDHDSRSPRSSPRAVFASGGGVHNPRPRSRSDKGRRHHCYAQRRLCARARHGAPPLATARRSHTHAPHLAGLNCDFRYAKVERRAASSPYEVFRYRETYPHELSNRSATWSIDNLERLPQADAWAQDEWRAALLLRVVSLDDALDAAGATVDVARSGLEFAFIENQMTGYSNEAGLAIGERTCEARLPGVAPPAAPGARPLWDIAALSRVAMARCATARCAVLAMGKLAVAHGYYNCDRRAPGEWGEALTVADGAEAWVFHVLADDTGASAVWAARRVPDGHVTLVANMFTIRGVPRAAWERAARASAAASASRRPTSSASPSARGSRWVDGAGARHASPRGATAAAARARDFLDFTASFGPNLGAPRDSRSPSPCSTRRVWRVFSLVAPRLVGARRRPGPTATARRSRPRRRARSAAESAATPPTTAARAARATTTMDRRGRRGRAPRGRLDPGRRRDQRPRRATPVLGAARPRAERARLHGDHARLLRGHRVRPHARRRGRAMGERTVRADRRAVRGDLDGAGARARPRGRAIAIFRTRTHDRIGTARGRRRRALAARDHAMGVELRAVRVDVHALFAGATREPLPRALTVGSLFAVDDASLFWRAALVGNWMPPRARRVRRRRARGDRRARPPPSPPCARAPRAGRGGRRRRQRRRRRRRRRRARERRARRALARRRRRRDRRVERALPNARRGPPRRHAAPAARRSRSRCSTSACRWWLELTRYFGRRRRARRRARRLRRAAAGAGGGRAAAAGRGAPRACRARGGRGRRDRRDDGRARRRARANTPRASPRRRRSARRRS